ncbi:TPM domain-containing protein, partial [Candidatus Bipolaricaulota bacterium]|nr:TPM domain-containing protein [Candidatus Bipolaricaulota bacterium]
MPSERLPDHRGPRSGRGGGNLRQLLALLVLGVGALSLAQEVHPLPLPLGRINDYGQTLERSHREALEERIKAFSQLGIEFWYLASWRDPYGNPWRYAAEIASSWGLSEKALLVVFVREGGSWRA